MWNKAKVQVLAKCRKLGFDDSAIIFALTRFLVATQFQIAPAIQRVIDYMFWQKSVDSDWAMEHFYPQSKDHVDSQVLRPPP